MSAESTAEPRSSTEGRILDEDIERMKRRVGIAVAAASASYNPVPDPTSMSHFAFGNGDDNPLFHDPHYGAATRWRGQIAPPTYLISAGVDETPRFTDPEMKALFRGVFRGVGKYFQSVKWTWWNPVYPHVPVFKQGWLSEAYERESSFGGGSRSVVETTTQLHVDRSGRPLASQAETYVNIERGSSRKAGKFNDLEVASYTADDIARIDEDYARESVRGAEPRYWEDVEVGDTFGPLVKGPTTVLDIISNQMARGWGDYAPGPLRYWYKNRQRMPKFYVENSQGIPDVVQRLHWEQERAEAIGLPAPYDYGQMRIAWLAHLLTDWMGDDAWLWDMTVELRGFNYLGDTHWCTGEVVDKRVVGEHRVVDIEMRATSQRDEVTAPGRGTIILPSREAGPVVLPEPPTDIAKRGAGIVARKRA